MAEDEYKGEPGPKEPYCVCKDMETMDQELCDGK
jgi:hypothetical protein